jgi:nicotinamidase-related amidase
MSKDVTPTANPFDRLDPQATALLVIDMQRYFVHQEYPFGKWVLQVDPVESAAYFERVNHIVIPNIQLLLKRFRSLEAQVAYTEFGSLRQDGRDMPGWARRHNEVAQQVLGSSVYPPFDHHSCRVDESVAPQVGEIVSQKSTSGPVNSTRLDQTLRVLGIDTVVVAGLVTDVCVAQTTREFGDRDFNAIVVEDACTTLGEDIHRAALQTIGRSFGTVLSTHQVLELLGCDTARDRNP